MLQIETCKDLWSGVAEEQYFRCELFPPVRKTFKEVQPVCQFATDFSQTDHAIMDRLAIIERSPSHGLQILQQINKLGLEKH